MNGTRLSLQEVSSTRRAWKLELVTSQMRSRKYPASTDCPALLRQPFWTVKSLAKSPTILHPHQSCPPSSTLFQAGDAGIGALTVSKKRMLPLKSSLTSARVMSSQGGTAVLTLPFLKVVSPAASQTILVWACAVVPIHKQASAIPARPTPHFFSAARRVSDWAMLFVSSSNLL